jgi:hypothetical protein
LQFVPSTPRIAHIAAILANGNPTAQDHPSAIADQALKLWYACEGVRNAKIDELAQLRRETEKEVAQLFTQGLFPGETIKIPTPKKFPVTFDEFLRLTVGGNRKGRRLKIYRDYVKEMIRRGHVSQIQYPQSVSQKYAQAVMSLEEAEKLAKPASWDEIESGMNEAGQLIYNSEELYKMHARDFLAWRAKQPTERARKAAAMRWSKEGPK